MNKTEALTVMAVLAGMLLFGVGGLIYYAWKSYGRSFGLPFCVALIAAAVVGAYWLLP